jgi:hypothetical protein
MKLFTSGRAGAHVDWALVAILLISLATRAILASHGGQGYYPDENVRYGSTVAAVQAYLGGDHKGAWLEVFSRADHLGFRVLMVGPAYLQLKWDLSPAVAVMMASGIFSVVGIALVYGIARRLGARTEESRWAALLLAVTTCWFYWARHFMPYDLSMMFGLACLFVAVKADSRWYTSLLAGFFGCCSFLTYNGYWSLVAVALSYHVLRGWPSWRVLGVRAILGLVGLVCPLYALLWWSARAGYYLLASFLNFSNSINQGDFGDAGRMIIEYLWHSERGLLVFWFLCLAFFVYIALRRQVLDGSRAWLGLFGIVIICFNLIYLDDRFVAYGRLIRQIAPFFALLGGWVVAEWCIRYGPGKLTRSLLASTLLLIGAANFARPLGQRWDFEERVIRYQAQAKARESLDVSSDRPQFQIVKQPYVWPLPQTFELPPHQVILQEDHVLRFEALLYEGYNREQRAVIRSTDLSSRLILLTR